MHRSISRLGVATALAVLLLVPGLVVPQGVPESAEAKEVQLAEDELREMLESGDVQKRLAAARGRVPAAAPWRSGSRAR